MNKGKERKFSIIAAIVAVLYVIHLIGYMIARSHITSIINWFQVVVFIGFAIALAMGKRNISLLVVSIMLTIYKLISFFLNLHYWSYLIIESKMIIICGVLASIIFTGFVVLFCIPGLEEKAKKYKFLCMLPPIIMVIAYVIGVFLECYELGVVGLYSMRDFWLNSLLGDGCLLYLFSGLWMRAYLTKPTTISAEDNIAFEDKEIGGSKIYNANASGQNGFIDIAMHAILLLVTCGIWHFIWIYKTTDYLNIVEGEEHRNPLNELLLCIFVPFYTIYWTYKSAQRIDKLANSKNIPSDLSKVCLIFAILLGIVPPILMQLKINEIATKKYGSEL